MATSPFPRVNQRIETRLMNSRSIEFVEWENGYFDVAVGKGPWLKANTQSRVFLDGELFRRREIREMLEATHRPKWLGTMTARDRVRYEAIDRLLSGDDYLREYLEACVAPFF
jgi:hypothetical protein